ncbi:hypothetical protein ACO0OE_000275 [Hanseniaspora uvarum]
MSDSKRISLSSYPVNRFSEENNADTYVDPPRPSRIQGMMNMGEEENSDEFISDYEDEKDKLASNDLKSLYPKRPKDNSFLQQRLKSYNPIFTPGLTISIFLSICAIFVLFGGILISISKKTNEIKIYYQECSTMASTNDYTTIPKTYVESYFHQLKTADQDILKAEWKYTPDSNAVDTGNSFSENGTCHIRFTTPYVIRKPVFMSYLIKDYYPNHRRYALSFNEDQLEGKETSINDIHTSTGIKCAEIYKDSETGKQIYPCGLIANAMFNDSFSMTLVNENNQNQNYVMDNSAITWSTNPNRFKKTKLSYKDIAPPPFWKEKYPDGYNETNVPDISTWQEFQNWMDNPALPIFSKLLGKNTTQNLLPSTYQVDITLNWPVREFSGHKAFYLTHGSSIGGRNNFLGEVYLVGGLVCLAAVVVVIGGKLLSGRRSADKSRLSWNQ